MKMEKVFTSLRSFTDVHHKGKMKFCVSCGNLATVEALFSVGDGVILIERYCDVCSKKVK
jgi:CRISPR/Cas system-associated protein Cas10 (large subunit of type III CRISPR-Cas system)